MISQPMSWSEPKGDTPKTYPGSPHSDLDRALQQHVLQGLSAELALDLALHELVIRAADATGASAAALALARDGEMVCRGTTGIHAPDLGVRLNTRDGLSGECLRTHEPQLCLDAESDPRVDAAASSRLGIRSMLIVPILDGGAPIGVIEVFSPEPHAFVPAHDMLLESFARTSVRLRQLALDLAHLASRTAEAVEPELPTPAFATLAPTKPRTNSDMWTLILGGLVIASAAALSFMIASRTGWLRLSPARSAARAPAAIAAESALPTTSLPAPNSNPSASQGVAASAAPARTSPAPNGLVVYEKGKVVFRMKPPSSDERDRAAANSATPAGDSGIVWLARDAAERRLRQRVEPHYPPEALASHRSGDVTLEVVVAEDGSISSIRTLRGDPLLAAAAATAVREWHYDPYQLRGHLTKFQTDITLKFSLPD